MSLDLRVTGLAACLLAASASSASAQEKITLRLADSLPSGHVIHELVAKPFMELVTKATNGQVIASSGQGYTDKRDCEHAIDVIKKGAEKAKVEEAK